METKAIYTSTSGTSHRACTAKSPKISAPIMEKELLSTSGVFREASLSRSIKNSTSRSWASRGTWPSSSTVTNWSQSGTIWGLLAKRYQMGVITRDKMNTAMRI